MTLEETLRELAWAFDGEGLIVYLTYEDAKQLCKAQPFLADLSEFRWCGRLRIRRLPPPLKEWEALKTDLVTAVDKLGE